MPCPAVLLQPRPQRPADAARHETRRQCGVRLCGSVAARVAGTALQLTLHGGAVYVSLHGGHSQGVDPRRPGLALALMG